MENYYSVTGELREWAKKLTHWWYDPVKDEYTYTTSTMPPSVDAIRLDERLVAIADLIDAEHEKALRKAYAMRRDDGIGVANVKDAQAEYLRGKNDGYDEGWDAGFASADDWLGQHEDAMAEHGWYRALDGDKTPIRIGDEVYQVEGGWVYTVKSITFYPDNTTVTFECKHGYGCDSAHNIRHYHAPTVEDVLREMLNKWGEMPSNMTNETIVAEYAAKLRLADDGKEQ